MKYYGIKKKIRQENNKYFFQKTQAKIQSMIPNADMKRRKEWYIDQYTKEGYNNSQINEHEDSGIPNGHKCELFCIVTSDLIKREDIRKLQIGIRKQLKKHRSNKYIGILHDSFEQIATKINSTDPTLHKYYENIECGIFDFKGHALQKDISHYTIRIRNINTSYLAIEFEIYLTDTKGNDLSQLIYTNYHDDRGYPMSYLIGKKKGGSSIGYTVSHYSNISLKADKIFEYLSIVQWEFYDALQSYFPFLLHKMGIMPPRIDVFKTDIDYHDGYCGFWESVGAVDWRGQFIDDNHKFFFSSLLSGRYTNDSTFPRLIYIYREDGKTRFECTDVSFEVHSIIRHEGGAFFTVLFSNVLAGFVSKKVIRYKQNIHKIKLKRNQLRQLLKYRYQFERDVDLFRQYTKDNPGENASKEIEELFSDNNTFIEKYQNTFLLDSKSFCNGSKIITQKLIADIKLLADEIDEKQVILKRLFDYKNVRKTWRLGVITLIIGFFTLLVSAIALVFSINPECSQEFLEWISQLSK